MTILHADMRNLSCFCGWTWTLVSHRHGDLFLNLSMVKQPTAVSAVLPAASQFHSMLGLCAAGKDHVGLEMTGPAPEKTHPLFCCSRLEMGKPLSEGTDLASNQAQHPPLCAAAASEGFFQSHPFERSWKLNRQSCRFYL